MEHIVDWFIVFLIMVGATILVERLSSLFRKRSTKRNMTRVLLEDSGSEYKDF